MAEAKFALKAIYEQASESHKEKVHIKRELAEIQETRKELIEKVESSAQALKVVEDSYAEQMATQQRVYEEKVAILLRQLRGVKVENEDNDSELANRCQFLNERVDQQEKQLEDQQRIITELNKRLEEIKKTSLQALTPVTQRIKKDVPKVKIEPVDMTDAFDNEDILDGSFVDDDEKDPDWRKTPLGKRILAERRTKLMRGSQMPDHYGGTKRSSDGGCTCKTKCNTVRCGCKKLGRGCAASCKCNESVCENRNVEISSAEVSSSHSISSNGSVDGDDTSAFKKPRVDNENVAPRRRKLKNKQLFLLDS